MADASSGVSKILPQSDRVRRILERLKSEPTPALAQDALDLIIRVVNEVEDAHSGKLFEENPGFRYKGRM